MLVEADAHVPRISPDQARAMIARGGVVLVDVREAPEVALSGKIRGALHVPRGMLEFRADPQSPYFDPAFRTDTPVILYCAVGGRSALAGLTLKDMGYPLVYNLGGFEDWAKAGGDVEPAAPGSTG